MNSKEYEKNNRRFKDQMAENGRKGGLARADKDSAHFEHLANQIYVLYSTTTLTQKEIAEHLKCSVGFVNKNSPSKKKPNINQLMKNDNYIKELDRVSKERELQLKLKLAEADIEKLGGIKKVEHARKKI